MLIGGWETPLQILREEIRQLEYEGRIVPEFVRDRAAELHESFDAYNESKITPLLSALEVAPCDPTFPYQQPNDLVGIRSLRPSGPRRLAIPYNQDELLNRMHGAWTGRAVGCALGKPVEYLGMTGRNGLNGRKAIRQFLEERSEWPLRDYFSNASADGEYKLGCPASCRETIAFMEPDDDIHYSLIALKILEDTGPDFEWTHVANAWNSHLPYNSICTAEAQAILNYNIRTPRAKFWVTTTTAEFTRRHNNPYREWIGAQIRADGWAYCCAGYPELAAEYAWRDAHWTHTANGIYGEMFMAAVIAAAFVEQDPYRLVEIGLSEIPLNCRLAEDLRWALQTAKTCRDFESFMELSEKRFVDLSPVHTNNNAVIVVMSLLYGKMVPEDSICLSVMGALDTDCNGATTGSIVGAEAGRTGFKGDLAPRLNDTIRPHVIGFSEISMSELAQRTLAVHKKIQKNTEIFNK